ncbi:MAG: NAD(P)H-hydrate dehydratase, partial [Bacteroidales bacterium]|nr:NAD(P)H-hydrate dehydratase [Bacteroidales bacterium]
ACLRSGIGLLSVLAAESESGILQVSVPEAMVELKDDIFLKNIISVCEKFSAIGIGPGIGTNEENRDLLDAFLLTSKPMLIDADAISIMGKHPEMLKLAKSCVFTPHPKEFDRLFAEYQDFDSTYGRIKFMQNFEELRGNVVVLKGGVTAILKSDGKVLFYVGRNPGIATGGSGDVLSGIITALLSQSYSIDEAAIIGVWAHGEAAKLACKELGPISTTATDIIKYLPLVFKQLYEKSFLKKKC